MGVISAEDIFSSRQVWKYELEIGEWTTLQLPLGWAIRFVGSQGDRVMAWIEVDPTVPARDELRLFVTGTGMLIPCNHEYVGTVFTHCQKLVWHVYKQLAATAG